MELADEFVGVTDAKNRLPHVLKRLQDGDQDRVVILRNNDPVAVIIPVRVYDELRELEAEREFLREALLVAQARQADDGSRWDLDDIKRELGYD
jgi:prevent-host-death family protein